MYCQDAKFFSIVFAAAQFLPEAYPTKTFLFLLTLCEVRCTQWYSIVTLILVLLLLVFLATGFLLCLFMSLPHFFLTHLQKFTSVLNAVSHLCVHRNCYLYCYLFILSYIIHKLMLLSGQTLSFLLRIVIFKN